MGDHTKMGYHTKINTDKLKKHLESIEHQQTIEAPFWTQLCFNDTRKEYGFSQELWATSFDDACKKAAAYWRVESNVPDGMSYMVWGAGGSIKMVTPLPTK
jgi:hypothetical protein|tara:strand:- start:325 stop:627 length:303 start_codon:yes stop_codon:yes gene_type:complete